MSFYCFKLIANAGIKKIYYLEFYRDERILQFANEIGIKLIDLSIINRITKVALSNNQISEIEKQLLDYSLTSAEDFGNLLNSAYSDGKIDEQDRTKLIQKREEIVSGLINPFFLTWNDPTESGIITTA